MAMNKSRRCHQCKVNWPNSHPGWVTCQICGAATEPQPEESDFESTEIAWAWVLTEKARLHKHKEFEIYYTDRLKEITDREIKRIQKASKKEWAAQFAKLDAATIGPTKEVPDGN